MLQRNFISNLEATKT